MKKKERDLVTLIVLNYMQNETGKDHRIGVADLQEMLEEDHNITIDRRTVYSIFSALDKCGFPIQRIQKDRRVTYYYDHAFDSTEIMILRDAIQSSISLSEKTKDDISQKLSNLICQEEYKALPKSGFAVSAENDTDIRKNISNLLKAISERKIVSFHYFDLDCDKTKKYRTNAKGQKTEYVLFPINIVSIDGRLYCIFYSDNHSDYANYRIDKIDSLQITQEEHDPMHFFDPESYMRKTFAGYTDTHKDTITVTCKRNRASLLFDRFGTDLIIRNITKDTFTASIPGISITPPLVAWFLQMREICTVQKPDTLIQEMRKTAEDIFRIYPKEELL